MDAPDRAPSWLRTLEALAVAVLLAVCVQAVVNRVTSPHWFYDLWADRDLVRAVDVANRIPTEGAELSYARGARIPGGAHYLLLAAVQAIDARPVAGLWLQLALEALAVAILALAALRRWGPLAAAVTAASWYGSTVAHEVLRNLWNPGLVPLFASVATVAAMSLVGARRAEALIALAAAVAVGAQFHLTVGLLALALLPGLALGRAPVRGRAVLAALGVVGIAYLPFLARQVAGGWAQVIDLVHPNQLAAVRPALDGAGWENMEAFLQLLFSTHATGQVHPSASAVRGLVAVLAALASVLELAALAAAPWLAWRAGPGPERRVLVLLAAVWAFTLTYLSTEHQVRLSVFMGSRYLIAFRPAMCLLAGWGAARLFDVIVGRRSNGLAAGMVVVLTASFAARVDTLRRQTEVRVWDPRTWSTTSSVIAEVRAATGWTLAELAGRTVLAEGVSVDRWDWDTLRGIDYLLHLEGERFPGSLAPPCGLVLASGQTVFPDRVPTADEVRHILSVPMGTLRVLDAIPLSDHALLVRYEVEGERCRSSFVNRYVDTAAEAEIRVATEGHAEGFVTELTPPAPGVRRIAFVAPRYHQRLWPVHHRTIRGAVDLETVPGAGVRAVLHAAQLRGLSYNDGWFGAAAVHDPYLRFLSDSGEEVRLPLARGWVGGQNQLTPLASEAVMLPAGTWRVDLRWFIAYDISQLHPVEGPITTVPFQATLAHDLVVDGG